MLHHVITFDEKLQNWPDLVISYKVIIGTKLFWLDIMKMYLKSN